MLTPLQKLPKNEEDLGKLIVDKGSNLVTLTTFPLLGQHCFTSHSTT